MLCPVCFSTFYPRPLPDTGGTLDNETGASYDEDRFFHDARGRRRIKVGSKSFCLTKIDVLSRSRPSSISTVSLHWDQPIAVVSAPHGSICVFVRGAPPRPICVGCVQSLTKRWKLTLLVLRGHELLCLNQGNKRCLKFKNLLATLGYHESNEGRVLS